MVQVQPENNVAPTGGGGGGGGVDGGEPGKGGAAHSSALVSSTHARRGRAGSGAKENQERRAKLLADLGDGTVLVSWANTGVEEVSSPCHRRAKCKASQPANNHTSSHGFRLRCAVRQSGARLLDPRPTIYLLPLCGWLHTVYHRSHGCLCDLLSPYRLCTTPLK